MKEKPKYSFRPFAWRTISCVKDTLTVMAAMIAVGGAISRATQSQWWAQHIPSCLQELKWEQLQELAERINNHIVNNAPIYYISIGFLISYILMSWYGDMRCTKYIRKVVHGCYRLNSKKYIKKSNKYIILHTGIHFNYLQHDETWSIIEKQMLHNQELKLIVIHPDPSKITDGECNALFDESMDTLKSSLAVELNRLVKFENEHATGRVIAYKTQALPLTPMIVLDNHLMLGYHLHAPKTAQTGLWVHFKHKKITSILDDMMENLNETKEGQKISPVYSELSPDEKNLLRPLWDIYYCMKNGSVQNMKQGSKES